MDNKEAKGKQIYRNSKSCNKFDCRVSKFSGSDFGNLTVFEIFEICAIIKGKQKNVILILVDVTWNFHRIQSFALRDNNIAGNKTLVEPAET